MLDFMEMMFSGGARDVSITIASSVRSPDIAALAYAAGWDGSGKIECTINPGVDVSQLSITGLPANTLTLINNGTIGAPAGGTGLYVRSAIAVRNNGTIFGGGGDGGSGGNAWVRYSTNPETIYGYGGAGGWGAGYTVSGAVSMASAQSGQPGSYGVYSGVVVGGQINPWARGGTGGTGGAIGEFGNAGSAGTVGGSYGASSVSPGNSGWPPGRYVDGNSYITWLANGVRLGLVA